MKLDEALFIADTDPREVAMVVLAAKVRELQGLVTPPVDPMQVVGLGQARELIRSLDEKIERLQTELEAYRKTVATGGPPPGFTETWQNGPSSRPSTAPPEEIVVELP